MRLNFRQGLISFQKISGAPDFLQLSSVDGYVAHNVSPTPTQVTFAHGGSNYIQVFTRRINQAWGPVSTTDNSYLYWDIDLLNARVTYGLTVLAPIVAHEEPTNPALDQHWFDLNVTRMKVWDGLHWKEKIRCFAGHVVPGVNNIVQYTEGTQVGINGAVNAGFILRDDLRVPLRKQNFEFLTEDDFAYVDTTANTSGVLIQPVNRVVPVRAAENIPRMSAVYISGEDEVRLASSNPNVSDIRPPVGLVIDDLLDGDIGNLVLGGELSYDQWSWTEFGAPIYINDTGELTTTKPGGNVVFRIGYVKNARTILIDIDPYGAASGNPPPVPFTVHGVNPVQVTDVTVNSARTIDIALGPHEHVAADVADFAEGVSDTIVAGSQIELAFDQNTKKLTISSQAASTLLVKEKDSQGHYTINHQVTGGLSFNKMIVAEPEVGIVEINQQAFNIGNLHTQSTYPTLTPLTPFQLLFGDGLNVVVSGASNEVVTVSAVVHAEPYDIALTAPGRIGDSEILVQVPLAVNVSFDETRSLLALNNTVLSNMVFLIMINDNQIGTVTVQSGQLTGTFTMTLPAMQFSAGDVLKVLAPDDAEYYGLSGVSATFAMNQR